MRNCIATFLIALLFILTLTACAARDAAPTDANWDLMLEAPAAIADANWELMPEAPAEAFPMPEEEGAWDDWDSYGRQTFTYDVAEEPAFDSDMAAAPIPAAPLASISAERIIHQARADVETDDFDNAVAQLHSLIERHRGFIQWADVMGQNFYARYHELFVGRQASFTIRVPVAQYNAMLRDVENLGAMTYLTTFADNVSAQYADIESRLAALRAQETRILALFEQADDMADILRIEDRLSHVIFEIERLSRDRGNLDNLVTYSTIHLSLREVEEMADLSLLNEPPPEPPTFFEELGEAFRGTLQYMGAFLRTAFIVLVSVFPWLIAWALIASIPLILIFRRRKKRKAETPSEQ